VTQSNGTLLQFKVTKIFLNDYSNVGRFIGAGRIYASEEGRNNLPGEGNSKG
jgi:hypothetical protein